MVAGFHISTILTLVILLRDVSGQNGTSWCRYQVFTHPRKWLDARATCRDNSKSLLHVTAWSEHTFLTSLLKTALPSISSVWLGLYYDMGLTSTIWQDDCSAIRTSTYNPVRDLMLSTDMCYMLHQEIQKYQIEPCYSVRPFVCQAATVDINTCFTQDTVIYNANFDDATPTTVSVTPTPVSVTPTTVSATPTPMSLTPTPVSATPTTSYLTPTPASSHADCYSLCEAYSCAGFLFDTTSYSCRLLTYTPSMSVRDEDGNLYGKALLQTYTMEWVLRTIASISEVCPHSSSSESPVIQSTEAPDTILPSVPTFVSSSTAVYLSSSVTLAVSSHSSQINTSPTTINLETELRDQLDIISNTTAYNLTNVAVLSETLAKLVNKYKDTMCYSLESIIQIEHQLTDKMVALPKETTAMNRILNSSLFVLNQAYGIQDGTGCHQNDIMLKLLELEDAIVKKAKLFLDSENTTSTVLNNNGTIVSITVGDGGVLPKRVSTDYGSVVILYPEVVRRQLSNQKVMSMVISYKENPFYTQVSENISAPVITTSIYRADRTDVPDFNFILNFPLTSETDITNNMKDMIANGTHFMAAFPGNIFHGSSGLVFIDVSTKEECRTYGKYGTSSPTNKDFDFYLYTTGLFSVKEYRPYELIFSYIDGIIQLPLHQTPVVIISQCQERKVRRKRSTYNAGNNATHGGVALLIGIAEVLPKVLDRQSGEWKSNYNLKVMGGKLSEINVQSNFFGTFSAGIKMLPPDQIDFQSVFLNFSGKVRDTPYVLGTIIAVIITLIITTPFLRRQDRIDSALWLYEHLIDNKADSLFYYYICISTGVRSQRQMNSSVYINIIGTTGETGPRCLTGNSRKNFTNASSSHFCLTTDTYLGNIMLVKIWLGQNDKSQSWYLGRLIIVDGRTRNAVQLKCYQWLSLVKGSGHTWRTLYVKRNKDDVTTVLEASANGMLEDNLWFSLIFRPRYSRFTRVQRLWSIVSLLFLAMISSAMFYDTPSDTSPLINMAGFELGFKEIYTGLMSSAITVPPCLIMTYIFNNRKRRGEEYASIFHDGNSQRSSGRLPWWSIFIAYAVLLMCIIAGSFFTFLYSLEWGPSLTIKWMSSFFLGTAESVFFIEPTKVLTLAVILVFFGSSKAHQKDFIIPPTSLQIKHQESHSEDHSPPEVIDCPCDKPETAVQRRRRYKLRMDRKLNRYVKKFAMEILYVSMLLVICTQQKVSDVFQQNLHLKTITQPAQKINTMDDVWNHIQTIVLQQLSPVEFYNGEVKSHNEMRFVGTNYRMGPIRLRQSRVSGVCTAPPLMKAHGITCIPNYDKYSEDTKDYNEGWVTANMSDELEVNTSPYRYQNDKEDPPYSGLFGIYGGGGYVVDLDFEPVKAMDVVNRLQSNVWLDKRTRVLFVESCLVNRNNLFFSQIRIVYEFPAVGGTFTENTVVSSNIYPYKSTFDFIILGLNIVFAIVIFVRSVLFIVKIIRTRGSSLFTFRQVVVLCDLVLSVTALVCLVMRYTSTVAIINTLRHDKGFLSSCGYVFKFDSYFSVYLGITTCIAILDLLQHLSFNYHFFLMYRTITAFRGELFQFTMVLMILILGFSSFIYLIYGHMEEKFKSISSGILTLFKMTIGIIKFRNDLELEDFGIVLMIAIYALVITLVYINIFTSSLNYSLSNIKELITKGKTSFDIHLNQHFWDYLASWLSLCRTTKTIKEKERTGTKRLRHSEVDLQQAELIVHRFMSTIVEISANDVERQKKFLMDTLLPSRHFKGPNYIWSIRRETTHGVQYRFSKRWSHSDNVFVLEFLNERVNYEINVECVPISEALNRGLVTYGHSTQPVSSFYIVNIKNNKTLACKVMLKISSVLLSSQPTFVITGCSDPTQWQQHTAKHTEADEAGVYVSVLLPTCPQYVVAVTSDPWSGIENVVQREHAQEFVLTRKKVTFKAGHTKSMSVSFPENAVTSCTKIRTLVEFADRFPILHVLASDDVSGPIMVEYDGKAKTNQLSDESFMKLQLLTKTGDLEWKQEVFGTQKSEQSNIAELKSLKAGVKTAITVRLSDYKISFARIANRCLEHEKETLLNIYKKKIPTRHWRQIGRSIGISQHKLALIENRKPRSLEEKACLVLGFWLKGNRSRSLNDIKHIWQDRVLGHPTGYQTIYRPWNSRC